MLGNLIFLSVCGGWLAANGGLTMMRSNGFVQTVASSTADLDRTAVVADSMPGIDSSW